MPLPGDPSLKYVLEKIKLAEIYGRSSSSVQMLGEHPEARDLIERLLCDADQRLGTSGGVQEIKSHKFFEGLNWDTLYAVTPPYRPVVSHDLDTRNFEDFEEDESMRKRSGLTDTEQSKDSNFVGYTYKNVEVVGEEVKKVNPTRPSLTTIFPTSR